VLIHVEPGAYPAPVSEGTRASAAELVWEWRTAVFAATSLFADTVDWKSETVAAVCVPVWLPRARSVASGLFAVALVATPDSFVFSAAVYALFVEPSVTVSADCVPVWLPR
jgi:hypothetical protein